MLILFFWLLPVKKRFQKKNAGRFTSLKERDDTVDGRNPGITTWDGHKTL